MQQESILVIDDEISIRKTIRILLESEGYYVDTAENGSEGLEKISAFDFNVVLLDLRLPDMSGMEILQRVFCEGHDLVVIVITAHGSIDSAVEAVKSGAFHYVTKPIDHENLKLLIRKGLEKKKLIKENLILRDTLDTKGAFSGIVGQSKQMKELVELVKLAAKSDKNVLIIGETGTGKEVIADAIHFNSNRKNHNYMKINCAALPESLLESEIFGYEKGAFTDAKNRKKGIFELADKGSILLDEIGCMSLNTQAKLLRVIEYQEVRRLGSEKGFKVDARIISSTNENIEEAIETRKFRKDLYYRMNVARIEIPPLRERKNDIVHFVNHFINKHSRIEKKEEITVSPEAMEVLVDYDWPGNVRELENVIQRAFMFDVEKTIGLEHLPKEIFHKAMAVSIKLPDGGATLKDITEEAVKRALELTNGNRTKAAQILGVNRESLRRWLKSDPKKEDA
ncbi:MAG: sigma-54 dependent transcriptional regulator [Victivallales bacterium]